MIDQSTSQSSGCVSARAKPVREIVTPITPFASTQIASTKRKGETVAVTDEIPVKKKPHFSPRRSTRLSCTKEIRYNKEDLSEDVLVDQKRNVTTVHEPKPDEERAKSEHHHSSDKTGANLQETMRKQVEVYYREVKTYWPTDLPDFEYILRPHNYYMEALDFIENPNLIVFCESHAKSPNVGAAKCKEDMKFGYISLVHCLAYGELHLLSGGNLDSLEDAEKNSIARGTVQFWKLLSVLAGFQDADGQSDPLVSNDCFSFLMARADKNTRVERKKAILQRLKERRIALVDASLFPIYQGSQRQDCVSKAGNKYYTPMNPLKENKLEARHLRASWEHYASPLITCFKPRNVLILSKRLAAQAKNIEAILGTDESVGKYRGARIHPSTTINNEKRLEELKVIRQIATESCFTGETETGNAAMCTKPSC